MKTKSRKPYTEQLHFCEYQDAMHIVLLIITHKIFEAKNLEYSRTCKKIVIIKIFGSARSWAEHEEMGV